MASIPILRTGSYLLVSIQIELHDRLAMALHDDLAAAILAHQSRGVVIDISALEVVDSFIGRILGDIAAVAKLLGAHAVVVGIRPAVAITLVELGVDLPHLLTALDVEQGLELLRRTAALDRIAMADG